MAKKKKVPAASTLTARKTEAPLVIARPAEAAPVAAPAPVAPVPVAPVPVAPVPVAIDRQEIARLAFAKFAARGYAPGQAVADWLSAEAELRALKN